MVFIPKSERIFTYDPLSLFFNESPTVMMSALATVASLAVLVFAGVQPPATTQADDDGPMQGASQPLSFVTRRGSQLLVDGKAARIAGANVYWLGLDENVLVNGSKLNYPTHFRVDDAFETGMVTHVGR